MKCGHTPRFSKRFLLWSIRLLDRRRDQCRRSEYPFGTLSCGHQAGSLVHNTRCRGRPRAPLALPAKLGISALPGNRSDLVSRRGLDVYIGHIRRGRRRDSFVAASQHRPSEKRSKQGALSGRAADRCRSGEGVQRHRPAEFRGRKSWRGCATCVLQFYDPSVAQLIEDGATRTSVSVRYSINSARPDRGRWLAQDARGCGWANHQDGTAPI